MGEKNYKIAQCRATERSRASGGTLKVELSRSAARDKRVERRGGAPPGTEVDRRHLNKKKGNDAEGLEEKNKRTSSSDGDASRNDFRKGREGALLRGWGGGGGGEGWKKKRGRTNSRHRRRGRALLEKEARIIEKRREKKDKLWGGKRKDVMKKRKTFQRQELRGRSLASAESTGLKGRMACPEKKEGKYEDAVEEQLDSRVADAERISDATGEDNLLLLLTGHSRKGIAQKANSPTTT